MNRAILISLALLVLVVGGCSRQQAPQPAAPAAQVVAPAQGSAPPMPAVETVAELPDYPGGVRVATSQRADTEHGFAKVSEATFTSADAFATVVAFYQKAVAERGWAVTGSEAKAAEVELKLAKGTSVGKVEVKQKPGLPVTIKLERRDR